MPEDRGLVPRLTVEENVLLPLWVNRHLDRKARLDFVYEVLGELAEMRHRANSGSGWLSANSASAACEIQRDTSGLAIANATAAIPRSRGIIENRRRDD
jgi:hypothetical protein